MKKWLIIPTYNESRNIGPLLDRIGALGVPELSIVVVDDHSPDGTGSLVLGAAARGVRVELLERRSVRGRGTAGRAGFLFALARGAEALLEMDADFSHAPELVPRLFEALEGADIAIASRLVAGSRDRRPGGRRLVTRLANAYARAWLSRSRHASTVRDWTTGFRAYRRSVFEAVPPASLVSPGPSVLQELLFRALEAGLRAVELPFTMVDREAGSSSFSRKVAIQSLLSIPLYRLAAGGSGMRRAAATRLAGAATCDAAPAPERQEKPGHWVID